MPDIYSRTKEAFDANWANLPADGDSASVEVDQVFDTFFSIFPLDSLTGSEGFDLGCGFGRIARRVAPRVGRLHCIDPSPAGLTVARQSMAHLQNVEFHEATVDAMPLADSSQDFGYSLGVLHHIQDTEAGLRSCVQKLKAGAPFLLYLYYNFDNRPRWYRAIWQLSEIGRFTISRLPFPARRLLSDIIAVSVYWPLSRVAGFVERRGYEIASLPLSFYKETPLSSLRGDALDRFGTPLERRFSREEIGAMMERSGLDRITFLESAPYWVAVGYRRS